MGRALVLVGGGHSHVEVLRRLRRRPLGDVRVMLVSRNRYTPYSGMLPGLVAGHYRFEEAHIDLAALCRYADVRLVLDEVVGLDRAARTVRGRSGASWGYDLLSINIGSTPGLTVPGADAHAVPVKPISGFLERWQALRARVLASGAPRRVAVVGAGAGGVELVLSVQHALGEALRQEGRDDGHLEYHLFAHALLPGHNERARRLLESVLAHRRIRVHRGLHVDAVQERRVRTADGAWHAADEVLWVTDAAAAPWLGASGLAVDERGFVRVDATLRSISDGRVFAAGDAAAVEGYRLPKAGVIAVRQGPPLAHNVRSALTGEPLRAYVPQRQHLSLISTGNRYAVASRGRWAAGGKWLWVVKDWIDRRFMERYRV